MVVYRDVYWNMIYVDWFCPPTRTPTYNFLSIAQQNVPITTIQADFILSLWMAFGVGLLLIGSTEIIWFLPLWPDLLLKFCHLADFWTKKMAAVVLKLFTRLQWFFYQTKEVLSGMNIYNINFPIYLLLCRTMTIIVKPYFPLTWYLHSLQHNDNNCQTLLSTNMISSLNKEYIKQESRWKIVKYFSSDTSVKTVRNVETYFLNIRVIQQKIHCHASLLFMLPKICSHTLPL